MKFIKLIITVWLAGVIIPLHSQNWQSIGGGVSGPAAQVRGLFADTINNLLYAVGTFKNSGDSLVLQIATWDENNWGKVGNGSGDTNCIYGCDAIFSVIKFDDSLFVGGWNEMMGGLKTNKYLSRWDGIQWNSCGKPNSYIWALKVANNELFAMGNFDTISNKPIYHIAKWNGTDWDSFGAPLQISDMVNTSVYYKGEYYFAGNFELGNGFNEIIRWNGTTWNTLENGVLGDSWVNEMVVYKNILFVGGEFLQATGNPSDFIIAWDGQHWFNPFPGIEFMTQVRDIEIFNNKLYIVGNFIIPNDTSIYAFANYDGINFCPFGGRAFYPDYPDPLKIAGLNGNIYVACNKTLFGDTVNYIAKFIGNLNDTSIYMPLSINSQYDNQNTLIAYPNPFIVSTTLKLSKSMHNATLNIYDVLGKEIKTLQNLNGPEILIKREGMKNGMYFFNLIDTKGLIGRGKMIVE